MKFKVEVEYSDDGPTMAGANHGRSIPRAEILPVECDRADQVPEAVRTIFKKADYYYQTLRRIGTIQEDENPEGTLLKAV